MLDDLLESLGRPSTRGTRSRRRAATAVDDKSEGEIDTRYLDDMTLVIDD